MKNHEFTIIASGFDPARDEFVNRLFEAGCDDATVSFQKGVAILSFDREAVSFSKAILSALENVIAAGGKAERIEPDHLVSLADISARTGLSRSAITNYHKGDRCSDFPAPTARVTSSSPLWDWHEVSEWLWHNEKIGRDEVVRARIVKEANLYVEHSHDVVNDNFVERLQNAERQLGPA